MRLKLFSVQKYRSISTAQKLPLSRVTTLIGPNNEGKSNILRALVVGMRLLSAEGSVVHIRRGAQRRAVPRRWRQTEDGGYSWPRDFPKSLQESQPNGRTIFDFEFELSDDELVAFHHETGSSLNGRLPIRLMIDQSGAVEVKVRKQGPGGAKLTDKAPKVARFVGSRIRVQYVPSIRTAEEARRVVDDMVSVALSQVETSDEFKEAVATIERVQKPVLEELSRSIRASLSEFLPDIRDVRVSISSEQRYSALRADSSVEIDDGVSTDLQFKGDGVQSLAAMALLRRAANEAQERDVDLVLAVEEPEAHLHPRAVHQLKDLLEEIGHKQQVIITTHSPLLANRENVAGNIIVTSNSARPARVIKDVRDVLGVRLADNLQSARLVLVVEGEDDVKYFTKILCAQSKKFSDALGAGELAIESLGGASNLVYKLSQLHGSTCMYHVFLDDDDSGRKAAQAAREQNLLPAASQTFSIVQGMKEAEIEDLFRVELYADALKKEWNVTLSSSKFRHAKKKWSDRLADVFAAAGQGWSKAAKQRAKTIVAQCVEGCEGDPCISERSGPIETLVGALEERLGWKESAG